MSKVPDTKKPAEKATDKAEAASDKKDAAKPADAKDAKATAKPDSKPETKPDAKADPKAAAAKPASKPEPKAAPKKKSGGSPFLNGFGIAAVLVIAAVIGGVITLKDWYPAVEPYVGAYLEPFLPAGDEGDDRVATLEAKVSADAAAIADLEAARAELSSRISTIMTRLERAERAVSDLRATAGALASGSGSSDVAVDGLVGRLSEMETANAASLQAIDDLTSRIEMLSKRQTGASAEAVQTQAMVLVVGQVQRAVETGDAFDEPLRTLAAAAGDDPAVKDAIAAMRPYAASGVSTLASLRRDFAADASEIVRAGDALAENDWIDAAVNKVSSLVTVRRVDGEGDPTSVDGIVAAAEDRLAEGDLAGAISVIETLESGAAEAASAWLAEARARQSVDDALTTLHDLAVSRLQDAAAGRG